MGRDSRLKQQRIRTDREVQYGYYLFAYCDLLGQKEELMKITALSHGPETQPAVIAILKRTAGRVMNVRQGFTNYFEAARRGSTDHLERLTPKERAEYLRMRTLTFHQVGFSDSFVISVPLGTSEEFGSATAAMGMWTALWGLAAMTLMTMSLGIPIRGGVDVERGVTLFSEEVYGPGLVRAYELESTIAKYPRLVIGRGLIDYLEFLELEGTTKWHAAARSMARKTRELIYRDPDDGQDMLHILAPTVLSESPPIDADMAKLARAAHEWVQRELDRFRESEQMELRDRYARLLKYFNANRVVG